MRLVLPDFSSHCAYLFLLSAMDSSLQAKAPVQCRARAFSLPCATDGDLPWECLMGVPPPYAGRLLPRGKGSLEPSAREEA